MIFLVQIPNRNKLPSCPAYLSHNILGSPSGDAVGDLWLAEEVFARFFYHKATSFQFKVGALNFPFIDRKFLGKRRWRRKSFTGADVLIANLSFNLFPHLRVDRAVGSILQFDVHIESLLISASRISPACSI